MKIIRDLAALPEELRHGAVSIGNFDGVHLGHARIIERLIERARTVGGPAVVLTFDPHPVRLLRPEQAPPPLTWTERKAELLAALGIDSMIAYPTDRELLSLTPEAFFEQIVCRTLQARALVEGPNFYFGRNRAGNVELLARLAAEQRIELEVVEPVRIEGEIVSSSRIRRLLSEGNVELARAMLTQPYRIRGMVVHGTKRGAQLGFPTANVDAIDTLLPAPGVYAGRATVADQCWASAIHIGPNPTFDERVLKVEVHLIGFSQPLYGQPLEVDFLARLRDIQAFPSPDGLRAQLARDVQKAKRIAECDTP